MASNLSNVINYCRIVNGSKGFNDTKTQFINEMTQDYNNAREDTVYRFDVLINSIDGKDVYVNNSETPIRGVIDVKRKQTADTEMQESLQVYPNQIKRGDLVKFKVNDTDILRTYLIKSKIEKKHGYDEGIFEECNRLIKWMYNGNLYIAEGILTNANKYTLGVSTLTVGISEGNSRYNLVLGYNDNTQTITDGQRVIFNNKAWKVTQADFVSDVGLHSILFDQTSINYEIDDMQNEIAGAFKPKHTYTWNLPTSFEVTKDGEYVLPYSIVDETGKDIDYNLVTVSTINTSLISIIKDGKSIKIKGLSVGTGSIKLDIPVGTTVEEKVVNFEVKSIPVNQVDYESNWSQTTIIKQYVTSVFTCKKTNNGVQDSSLKIDFSFDVNGQNLINSKKIIVTKISDSSFSIKNALVNVKTDIYVTVTDVNSNYKILDNQLISLINGM